MATDPLYADIVFATNFGTAGTFTTFDRGTGEISISPGESMDGEYELKFGIALDSRNYKKTMYLSVQAKVEMKTVTKQDA